MSNVPDDQVQVHFICTVAYGEGGQSWYWRYEYGTIPDEIQPVVVYQELDENGELLTKTITKFSDDL